jgi:hypothetical protein
MGFGSDAWDRLFGQPRPAELHPFREIRGVHHAVSTPGDLLFHIRAMQMGYCFEMARAIMDRIGDDVAVVDEVHGFQYFDERDLLGFVDGTENPVDAAASAAAIVGDEDATFAGGSYVITQKYLHDLRKWEAMTVEYQEGVIGRHKLSDIEFEDSAKQTYAHNVLTNIVENGEQLQIVRANMPFGEFGRANSARISSATRARRSAPRRCSTTCSSACRRATTIACSTSARPSPATCSSCLRRRSSTTWRSEARRAQRRNALYVRNAARQRVRVSSRRFEFRNASIASAANNAPSIVRDSVGTCVGGAGGSKSRACVS